MARRGDIVETLSAYEHELGRAHLSFVARHRIAAAIAAKKPRRWRMAWMPAFAFVAGAALVLLATWGATRPGPTATAQTATTPTATTETATAFTVRGSDCVPGQQDGALLLRGSCEVSGDGVVLHSSGAAVVELREPGWAVGHGHVRVQVDPVAPGEPPTRVLVSGGAIEVLGTEFVIDQDDDGGSVELLEGKIRFVGHDGAVTTMRPGDRHRWSVQRDAAIADRATVEVAVEHLPKPEPQTEPTATPEPPKPAGSRAKATPRGTPQMASALIEEVDALKRARRPEKAVAVLREGLAKRWDRRTAEVLSYELGSLLAGRLGDRRAACRHFRGHQLRFGGGRYASRIEQLRREIGCRGNPAPVLE